MIGTGKTITCDLCKAQVPCLPRRKVYDAMDPDSTKWGYMCPTCFKATGAALGTGLGQQYQFKAGVWVKTAG